MRTAIIFAFAMGRDARLDLTASRSAGDDYGHRSHARAVMLLFLLRAFARHRA